jgi:esterase/lipase
MSEIDDKFFERADEHIYLSNRQLSGVSMGKVSASMMYSVARFNAWVSACGFNNSKDMNDAKQETIQYFVTEYEKMLRENLEDYIENFENYMTQTK